MLFLGSILAGSVLTAASGLLPVAVGCGGVPRGLVGHVFVVNQCMCCRKHLLCFLKSKVLRVREIHALLVFQAEKDEMCLWHLGLRVLHSMGLIYLSS